jgi:beta-lactam-binding protein with PASTA domain
MKSSDFFKKLLSSYLWLNLLAMAVVVVLLCLGVKYGIDLYTHHGEKIEVPDVRHKSIKDAEFLLEDRGLVVLVSDTGYIKTLPPDCVLEQSPAAGAIVKSGRIVYLIINSDSSPKLTIPDLVDNSSAREARAKLLAMGFKVLQPEYVPGEKDWVYGIKCRGRNVVKGDRVSVEDPLILQIGDGKRDTLDSVIYTDPIFEPEFDEEDEFEEVTEPEPATPTNPVTPSEPAKVPEEKKTEPAEPVKNE